MLTRADVPELKRRERRAPSAVFGCTQGLLELKAALDFRWDSVCPLQLRRFLQHLK